MSWKFVRGSFIAHFPGIISLVFAASILHAQLDSIQLLEQIEVTATRIDLTDIGKHTDPIDSQRLAGRHYDHLASMLSDNSPLFIRSYGAGTLATLGIRGGSAAHTQVLWNGIPIRNPMLGLIDLALLPTSFIDEASIHYGGHGAAFGSGAVGGLIALSTDHISRHDKIIFHAGIGSWGARQSQLQINYGTKKIRFASRFFSQHAENNYRFRVDKDLPERRQVHHQLKNQGLLQEIAWQPTNGNILTARLWYQSADRQIPPTSTQTTSKAAQQDKALRASLHWNHQGRTINWQLKTAYLDEIIDYQDTLILLYTHNQFKTWLGEAEASFRINRSIHFTGGINTETASAESANYVTDNSRNQSAVFSSVRMIAGDWILRFQIREEVTGKSWSPLLADLAGEWNGIRNLTLKSSLSRNYRMPTLNDLHWRPGGNSLLLPEQGWTLEGGLSYELTGERMHFASSVTGYTRKIHQWIMWMPPVKDIRNYWSPINITQVFSRGLESRAKMGWVAGNWKLNIKTGVDLTWSTFQTPLIELNIKAGDQLFYIPVENAIGGAELSWKKLSLYYDHHWFGPSSGINDDIRASSIGSGGISVGIDKDILQGLLYLQVANAWDVPYRIIERRPMAGRTISGGVKFTFGRSLNKTVN